MTKLVTLVSKWGAARFGDAGGSCSAFLAALNSENGSKSNNILDALIGATALSRQLILVTDDEHQKAVCRRLGGMAITLPELLARFLDE